MIAKNQQSPISIGAATCDQLFHGFSQDYQNVPSYIDIYTRWEKQHWRVSDLDFSIDRKNWESGSDSDRAKWMIFGRFAAFHLAEGHGADLLTIYNDCFRREEQRLVLSTQFVDEARHNVYFARFYEEVIAPTEGTANHQQLLNSLSPALRHLIFEMTDELMSALHKDTDDRYLLTRAITLSHLVQEGTIALSVMRSVLKDFRRLQVFPGFSQGYVNIVRDEARHALFGVVLLRDLIANEPALKSAVIEQLDACMPTLLTILSPLPERATFFASEGKDPTERRVFALSWLQKRLRCIGVDYAIPGLDLSLSA